jgi:hypothetical protein
VLYSFSRQHKIRKPVCEIAMTLTLVLICGIAIALSATFVVATRSYGLAEPVLAGEATAVGLADPTSDTLGGYAHNGGSMVCEWHLTTVSALSEAEDLLDLLEAQGYEERELVVMGNSCFAVRWR